MSDLKVKPYDKKASFTHQIERNRKLYPRTKIKGSDKKPAHENERNRKLL